MAGQLLLTSAPSDGVGIYCAWWPWGNGKTISIRLGVFHEEEGRGGDGRGSPAQVMVWPSGQLLLGPTPVCDPVLSDLGPFGVRQRAMAARLT